MSDLAGFDSSSPGNESSSSIPRPPFILAALAERQSLSFEKKNTFLELFDHQAQKAPKAVAVTDPAAERKMTYEELAKSSDQLAEDLKNLGLELEMRVGLFLEKSLDLMIAILGVWKAGGVYVPLDPAYPAPRLGQMADDALVSLIITHRDLRPSWRGASRVRIVDLGLEPTSGKAEDVKVASSRRRPEPGGAAYIIYTSGTTGRPKGVLVEHRSLTWYVETFGRRYGICPEDQILQFSSIGFDLSLAETCLALAHGATLIFRTERMVDSMSEFLRSCREWAVTVVMPPTAFFHELSAAVSKSPSSLPRSLRLVSFGGEGAIPERVAPWLETVGRRVRLLNAYGPTEATIEATVFEFSEPRATASIGRPVADVETYVLDRRGEPSAPGRYGELCLAGPGLARGYQGRPAETAASFVPHPFPSGPGERLYRTGDLAQMSDHDNLILGSRTDRQVKIRGYRIEPEEIEHRLVRHREVRQAAVVPREDQPGHQYLTAYVVLEETASASGKRTAELRAFLEKRLPAHMVPASFHFLPSLPLTPNGKIDRAALASGASFSIDIRKESFAAPRTPIERALIRIWSEVLHLEEIGINDNIFELGGDSILNLQIVSRAHEEGLLLTPKDLFQYQTIAELATVAAANARGEGARWVEQGLVRGDVPLTPIQLWFMSEDVPRRSHFNQDLLLEVRRPLDAEVLEQAVARILEHHDVLRLRFRQRDGVWRQGHAPPSSLEVPVVSIDLTRCRRRPLPVVIRAVTHRLQASLDLVNGPLFRVAYFDRGPLPGRLFIAVNHLVVDGVSWRILIADLERAYLRLEEGRPAALPRKTTSYKAWSEKLRTHAQAAVTRREIDYWLRVPREVPPLPIDYPYNDVHEMNTRASVERVTAELTAEETRRLLRSVPAAYRTRINDVLLAALLLTVERWTGDRRLLVELEGHGREDIIESTDLSRTTGWFTSAFPVFLAVDSGASPGEILQSVKEQLRAIPRQGVGYYLLRYLSDDPDLRRKLGELRQPQWSFNYLGQMDPQFARSALFSQADEPTGERECRQGRRSFLLEIDGFVAGERLWINWRYCCHLHRRSTIERLAVTMMKALRGLISYCLEPHAGGFTASDFPLARLTTMQLKQWVGTDSSIEDIYPLAPVQEGILFHALYAPESQVYFEQNAWLLQGRLDAPAFHSAWERLVERHAILRTAFAWQGLREPLQIVRRRVAIPWREIDWQSLGSEEQKRRLEGLLAEDRRRGFTLTIAPLMRAILVRLDAERHYFVWSVHHLLLDGWSFSLLLGELLELYDAMHHGSEPELPSPRPFRDYIAWLGDRDRTAAEHFWRRYLEGYAGVSPTLAAATAERAEDPSPWEPFLNSRLDLGLEPTAGLRAFSRRYRLTLNTIVQGAWAAVLSRTSCESDAVFGTTIAGRPQSLQGVDGMIGLLINTLPVRVPIGRGDRLLPWLLDLQDTNLDLRQHGWSSLIDIKNWAGIPHDRSLFKSSLGFQNFPGGESALRERHGALLIRELRYFSQTNFPLTLLVSPEDRLWLEASYDPRRFSRSGVHRLLNHLRVVLESIADASPATPVLSLPLLSASARHQVLREWNERPNAERHGSLFPRIFQKTAQRTCDTVALRYVNGKGEEASLSYRELEERSNRYARELCSRPGVLGGDRLVGLSIERSPELVVAMLGIMKAGAAFLSLDPGYPPARLAFMLEDAEVKYLIARKGAPPLPGERLRRLFVEDLGRSAKAPPAEPELRPENLAYVIYTSGSTGRPKGVLLHHRGLANLALDNHLGSRSGDVVMQFAKSSFDAAVAEISMALAAGATLDLGETGSSPVGRDLARHLRERRITQAILPPAVVNTLPADSPSSLPALRTLVVAGEACPGEIRCRWRSATREIRNAYGPTEATVCATMGRWHGLTPETVPGRPSIGRPLSRVRVYVVDVAFLALPAGLAGELMIGGVGVGRGYLRRPRWTAERFVPEPWSRLPGERAYRTGDLVRYLDDGRLDFLGRLDHQIKIRGFRVELGEIESVLREEPSVRDAAVFVKEAPAAALEAEEKGSEKEHVEHWRTFYDDLYRRSLSGAAQAGDPLETVLWTSVYTGRDIPLAERREWIDPTVRRISALAPRRVLEIGCGNGLVLFAIAAKTERYLATDFSSPVVEALRRQLESRERRRIGLSSRLELRTQAADDFAGIPEGVFDTVILSSVVQYFPSAAYLLRVLRGAVRAAAPGGRIFLGDVPGLHLRSAYYASIELHRARSHRRDRGRSNPRPELRWTIDEHRESLRQQRRQEKQLLIAPGFFRALRRELPEITDVEIRPKAGRARNELSRFSFDAVLHLADGGAESAEHPAPISWLDGEGKTDLPEIRAFLRAAWPRPAGVRHILDRRLFREGRFLDILERPPSSLATLEDLIAEIDVSPEDGLEPDDLEAAARELTYSFEIASTDPHRPWVFDAVFQPCGNGESRRRIEAGREGSLRPSETFVRSPLRAGRTLADTSRSISDVSASDSTERELIAYIAPHPRQLEESSSARGKAWQREHVARWRAIHEDIFDRAFPRSPSREGGRLKGATFRDSVGWNSSYSGRPLAVEDMEEWLELTSAQVLSLGPRRVLEIGCGVGSLALRIAPQTETYLATDFSQSALDLFRSRLDRAEPGRSGELRIELLRRRADEFSRLENGIHDTVIINSVVQYFPSIDYLSSVLRGLIDKMPPGGSLFLGDVRSLPLHRAFCASVELYRADDSASVDHLRHRVLHRQQREEELLLDPAYFFALQQEIPRVRQARIRPKRGWAANELTRFRYDVTLTLADEVEPRGRSYLPAEDLDWLRDDLDSASLRYLLESRLPPIVVVRDIPNLNVARELALLEFLAEEPGPATVGDLRQRLKSTSHPDAVAPEDLFALTGELPYEVDLSWTSAADGSLTALYRRQDVAPDAVLPLWNLLQAELRQPSSETGAFGNQPLRGRLYHHLVAQLRQRLTERLPSHMMPKAFVIVDALPLTPSGKVDKSALPSEELAIRPAIEASFKAPRTTDEERLAALWSEVLGVGEIGVDDHFFELGGHSLLATRIVSRVRQVFGVELPLRHLFENPTIARLATHLATSAPPETSPPEALPRGSRPPLSYAQHRLWFLDQLVPASPAYNMDDAWLLAGRLDVPALLAAHRALLDRHEVLRTTFPSRSGRPWQQIAPQHYTPELPEVDLQGLDEPQRHKELKRLAESEARRPFELARGPLLRLLLIRKDRSSTAEGESVLLRTVHHIVSDGWSEQIFYRELALLYGGFATRRPSPLLSPKLQYADFALWQRRWLENGPIARQMAYWRTRLAELPHLDLPSDAPRPAARNDRGATEPIVIGSDLTTGLRELGTSARASLFMVLLGAFTALLGRYTGQTDLAVGTPVAGRRHRRLEDLIGFFVNNLVLRCDLAGDPKVRLLLSRLRDTALEAYAHQDLPFERLVEELRPERELVRSPLFQVVLALHPTPVEEICTPELRMYALHLARERVTVDVEFHLWEKGEGVEGYVVYHAGLFSRTRMRRMIGHMMGLVREMVEAPGRRLSTLGVLTPSERHQLRVEWNDSRNLERRDEPDTEASELYTRLFEAVVEKRPAAIALRFADGAGHLSYAELDRRADRLAARLSEHGVTPERRVGIFLERSPHRVWGWLGVLKAGGAFVPLDPSYPERRLSFMIEDAGLFLCVTESALLARLPVATKPPLCLDQDHDSESRPGGNPPRRKPTGQNLAYVIYTSGSTGRPKGAMLHHRGLTNLAKDLHLGTRAGDRVLQFAPFGFDAALSEMAMTLAAGATLELTAGGAPLLGQELAELLEKRRITQVLLPPSALRTLPEENAAALVDLRTIMVAGEACPEELPGRFLSEHRELRNAYGPTETTICATAARLDPDAGRPPIGRPIENLRVFVLGRGLEPVPLGVAGELGIAGTGVGRGYLDRPGHTAERFLPDAISAGLPPGRRLYRTGDLVRSRADGRLEFLRRIDAQVQLRGFRVEPGEIEALLEAHEGVSEAVVLFLRDGGRDELVAYLVPEGENAPDETDPIEGLRREQVESWRRLYDDLHRGRNDQREPAGTFDTRGWQSSYNGRPIPDDEMREWVDGTVERALAASRVTVPRIFEIGCGTGLLLWRLAAKASEYLGTDLSEEVIRRLEAGLAAAHEQALPKRVRLRCQSADCKDGVTDGHYDLVVLSSVVQYFPDVSYLLEVLGKAIDACARHAAIFLGDLRSLPLQEALYADVELSRAASGMRLGELRQKLEERFYLEEELLLAPVFFTALQARFPRLSEVRIEPKVGRFRNELNGFRYDVTLYLDEPRKTATKEPAPVVWHPRLDLAALRREIDQRGELALERLADVRISRSLRLLELLRSPDCPPTVAELRADLAASEQRGLEPADLYDLAREAACVLEWKSTRFGLDGCYDLLFRRSGSGDRSAKPQPEKTASEKTASEKTESEKTESEKTAFHTAGNGPPREPGETLSNDPLLARQRTRLVPDLHAYLGERLASFMVPSAFVVLRKLPRLPNHKVDRAALLLAGVPLSSRLAMGGQKSSPTSAPFRTPVNATEAALAAIWREVLGLDGLGTRDNFFDLGGHSLLATRVIARIREEFAVSLPLRLLFEHPTISELAAQLDPKLTNTAKITESHEEFEELIL